ncbi:MAG TPA: ABC transporter ATP-binding protein [Steroidobacteraceae bacterium]|jgi:sulfate transport system ATP-binding protein|nr:ABC transporter ATP-binding protein [Steroidobacteraceae bacterium]
MSITLDQITKRYRGAPVVNDVSVDIGDGEFFVLLGPSGSGKSTLLRAIAGLTGVDHGRISLHGRDVTHVAARARGVGLVFQNYALFRHMTVADNIEFALRVRRMRASARRERRRELLRLVALEGMDNRLPVELSGGQQQRVAVARALAHKPEVLLLDEPFGALDAKIREELRRTIREVQRELGITTILVTHDQEEAFALADRIGIMNLGRLLELGRPEDLYARPATRFVATFLGAANLVLAQHTARGICIGGDPVMALGSTTAPGGRDHEVVAVMRPEDIEIAPSRDELRSSFLGLGTVEQLLFVGANERLRVRLNNAASAGHVVTSADSNASEALLEITRTQHDRRNYPVNAGQCVTLGVRRLHVLATPLSSFTACASSAPQAQAISEEPLLVQLATRMKTRVSTRVEPAMQQAATEAAAAPFAGVAVINTDPGAGQTVQWLLQHGAEAVLLLPHNAVSPVRVLIHWLDEPSRRATLAVSASMLRHVSAEAVYIGILADDGEAARPDGLRALLDARSEAQAVHGLEIRTELGYGDVAEELTRRLAEMPEQLLILGVSDISVLTERFAALLSRTASPLLVVWQPGDPPQQA